MILLLYRSNSDEVSKDNQTILYDKGERNTEETFLEFIKLEENDYIFLIGLKSRIVVYDFSKY